MSISTYMNLDERCLHFVIFVRAEVEIEVQQHPGVCGDSSAFATSAAAIIVFRYRHHRHITSHTS